MCGGMGFARVDGSADRLCEFGDVAKAADVQDAYPPPFF